MIMKKFLTIAAILLSTTAPVLSAPGDERPAASPLLEAASQAMLEEGTFTWCDTTPT
jgi:hypothetical protein